MNDIFDICSRPGGPGQPGGPGVDYQGWSPQLTPKLPLPKSEIESNEIAEGIDSYTSCDKVLLGAIDTAWLLINFN